MQYGHFDDANREYVITTPKTPLPDNPYHRCFTQNRSFEELAAARRLTPDK